MQEPVSCAFRPMCLGLHEVRSANGFKSRVRPELLAAIARCANGRCFEDYGAHGHALDHPGSLAAMTSEDAESPG